MARYYVRPGVPTENGWPMVNADKTVSVTVVPAAKKVPLLRGDVATILNAFIILYDKRVEKISFQVWGWSPYNDVADSNHVSGTAIDINAPKYTWGSRLMPASIIAKVKSLLADFEGVIFWGGYWSRPDEMHFQIGLPPGDPRVKALANKLNSGYLGAYGPAPAPDEKKETSTMARTTQDYILDQLVGYPHNELPGWSQLGGRSLVDAIGAIGAALKIEGFRDTKK